MLMYALAFGASFLFVFLKSFQQLNVVDKQYWFILPTSFFMAACEVYVVATTAKNGWGAIVLFIGLGGGLGSMLSVWIHDKITKYMKEKNGTV